MLLDSPIAEAGIGTFLIRNIFVVPCRLISFSLASADKQKQLKCQAEYDRRTSIINVSTV